MDKNTPTGKARYMQGIAAARKDITDELKNQVLWYEAKLYQGDFEDVPYMEGWATGKIELLKAIVNILEL